MRILGAGVFVAFVCVSACATGGAAGGADDDIGHDSGIILGKDSGTKDSGGGSVDSGGGPKDSGLPPQDSGGGNCGGSCSGVTMCCNNTCVDTTSDPNNCGGCGNPCGTESCCSGSCVDTMGSDNANCGGCGITCVGTCMNGVCQTQTTCTVDNQTKGCSHSVCVTGGALPEDCDIGDDDVTFDVCDPFGNYADDFCCTTSWDSTCVQEADDDLMFNYGLTCGGC